MKSKRNLRALLFAASLLLPAAGAAAQELRIDSSRGVLLVHEGRQPVLQIQAQKMPDRNEVGIIVVDGTLTRTASSAHRSPRMVLASQVLSGDRAAFRSIMESGRKAADAHRAAAGRSRPGIPQTRNIEPGDWFRDLIGTLIIAAHPGSRGGETQADMRRAIQRLRPGEMTKRLPGDQVGLIASEAAPVPSAGSRGTEDDLAGLVNAAHRALRQRDPGALAAVQKSAAEAGIGFLSIRFDGIEGESAEAGHAFKLPRRILPNDDCVFLVVDAQALLFPDWDDAVQAPGLNDGVWSPLIIAVVMFGP